LKTIQYLKTELSRRGPALIALTLCSFTLIAYWPVQDNEFLLWDDYSYIVENQHVSKDLDLEGVLWAFTSSHSGNWHPLTWLSHMMDAELFGLNPAGHHWTNLILHISNALLLFYTLRAMTGSLWRSALTATLFSLHPVHVESVAWVSERKDVLSTLFWMLSLLAYLGYAKRRDLKGYVLALLFFACGLMSKPIVTLPFVLLLLDYWPLARYRELLEKGKGPLRILLHLCMEKIPFFVLSGCSSLLTFFVQKESGAVALSSALPLDARLSNAVISYVRYMANMFWPVDLSAFYPFPTAPWPFYLVGSALVLLTALTVMVIISRQPYLSVGWFWYVGTLFPVIGLVQVGSQAMADRYTYIPHIGVLIALVWSVSEILCRRPRGIPYIFALCGLLILLLGVSTHRELGYWKDTASLFSRAIHVTRNNHRAHFLMGEALSRQGRMDEAVRHYSEAVRIAPGEPLFLNGLAVAQLTLGRHEEAILLLHEAIRIRPGFAEAMANLGSTLRRQGDRDGAILYLRKALQIKSIPEAHHLLGLVLSEQGKLEEAISHYRQALDSKPDNPKIHNDLAVALYLAGDPESALFHLSEALRFHPGDSGALHNLRCIRSALEQSKRSDRHLNSLY
jgi:Flp pilus assembly protein TadD